MNLKRAEWSSGDYDGLFEKEVPSQLLQNPLLQKDIWRTKEDLKIKLLNHKKILTINFKRISIDWLKILTKVYVLYRVSQGKGICTIDGDITAIKKFNDFLEKHTSFSTKNIQNDTFEQFEYWLNSQNLKENTIGKYYESLSSFLDTCRLEGWLDVNTYYFQGKKNRIVTNVINYIPEEVWNQLEEKLHYFPEPMQRKVLIIRTLGLRIGELLNLSLDCLRKRENQWRLRLKETEKIKIEDELPVPLDLVPVIKEQQKYIKKQFKDSYKKLFCANSQKSRGFEFNPKKNIMRTGNFNCWLNKLAEKHNICSKDGEVWHFTSHQFRRTVGTIMTNAGVRDLIIQKYLRHRNPDMQKNYKHLLKEVIGVEYQELIQEKNFVNIEGKLVATHKPQNAIEEYMRLRMHQITTQQGECHRSNLKKPCPTVNGCWRCGDWMTSERDLPYLKQDLERLKNELKKAEKLGMVRVVKEIQKDLNHLQIRINTLEEIINND